MVKLAVGSSFLKPENIISGDLFTVISEGEYILSKFQDEEGGTKQDFYLDVSKGGNDYRVRCNYSNQKNLAKVLGKETQKWIGAEIKVEIVNVMVAGNLKKSFHITVTKKPTSVPVEPTPIPWDDSVASPENIAFEE